MHFCTDQDLERRRAGILELLPQGAAPLRELAAEELTDDLDRCWYRGAAAARGVDWRTRPLRPEALDPALLRRLCVLKTLVLAHEQLMRYNSAEADGFERHRALYDREYRELLASLAGNELRYDWGPGVSAQPTATLRRLERG